MYLYDESHSENVPNQAQTLSTSDMKSVIELLSLYSEINQKVIDDGLNKTKIFRRVTEVMQAIIGVLKEITITLDDSEINQLKIVNPSESSDLENVSLWSFF